ncbi:MAG: DoxX, partial [Actinomycetia bacterium]|nr:DoxX [Actinomycetes bacterium]
TGNAFEQMGLTPGREMAALAGVSEFGGGLLTALGLGGPIGPVTVASTMAVAAGTAHRGKGAFAMTGGPELPLAYIAGSVAVAAAGPGRLSLDTVLRTRVPRTIVALTVLGSATAAAVMISRSIAKQERDAAETAPPSPSTDGSEPAEPVLAGHL